MVAFIYQIRNLVSGKLYIGKTNNPDTRWARHLRLAARGSKQAIHDAMRKHGTQNFIFEVIESRESDVEAFLVEKQLIAERGTMCPSGYNMNEGGEGGSRPILEVRLKITNALMGVKHSLERRKRQSERRSGENGPMWGRKHSEETKAKMRAAALGRKHTLEARKKMSDSRKHRVPWNKGKKGVYSDETLKKIGEASRKRVPWNKGKKNAGT